MRNYEVNKYEVVIYDKVYTELQLHTPTEIKLKHKITLEEAIEFAKNNKGKAYFTTSLICKYEEKYVDAFELNTLYGMPTMENVMASVHRCNFIKKPLENDCYAHRVANAVFGYPTEFVEGEDYGFNVLHNVYMYNNKTKKDVVNVVNDIKAELDM